MPKFQVFPVHMLLIAQNGIHIIENFFLEEIAEAGVHEFVVVVPSKVNSSTSPIVLKKGTRVSRTKRRSLETTACTLSDVPSVNTVMTG